MELFFRSAARAALFLLFGASPGLSQEISIVPIGEIGQSTEIVENGSQLMFGGFTRQTGIELWRIGQRPHRLLLVKNIFREASNGRLGHALPRSLASFGGQLFFLASPGDLFPRSSTNMSNALFTSDGTALGTRMVQGFAPVRTNSTSGRMVVVGEGIYFTASGGVRGHELWRSSGTQDTTVLVKDIRSGEEGSGARILGALGPHVLFVANDGTHGEELWRSDGTADGTRMVGDVNGVPAGSAIKPLRERNTEREPMTTMGGEAYFAANDSWHGQELWRTTGGGQGVELVSDLSTGTSGTSFLEAAVVENTLFLATSLERRGALSFHRLDAQSPQIEPIRGFPENLRLKAFGGMARFGDDVFVVIKHFGVHLWRVGAVGEAVFVKTLLPSVPPNFQQSRMIDLAGHLVIAQAKGVWLSDGTATGTMRIPAFDRTDVIDPAFVPTNLFAKDGVLYFSTRDPAGKSALFRTEPALCRRENSILSAIARPCLQQRGTTIVLP